MDLEKQKNSQIAGKQLISGKPISEQSDSVETGTGSSIVTRDQPEKIV